MTSLIATHITIIVLTIAAAPKTKG